MKRETPSEGEVIAQFVQAMLSAGFHAPTITPNLGDFERFDAPGDKRGRKNGYYKLLTGDYPIGWFGDWKTGEQHQWEFHDKSKLSQKEVKALAAEHRRLKAEAEREKLSVWAERAEDAQRMWREGSPDVTGHPYLTKKGIDTPKGLRLRVAADGTQLVMVPMWRFDMNGKPQLQNLQFIAPDGSKRYMKGARKDDTFFSLRGSDEHPVAVLCEGMATGFSIWKATGLSVFVAFDSGNLTRMARELEQWRPMVDKLIAGDNDVVQPDDWEERGRGKAWVNAGKVAAEKAAKACGGKWVLPVFDKGPARHRTDFNDLERSEGVDAVRAQIWGALGHGAVVVEGDDGEIVQAKLPDQASDESWRNEVPSLGNGNPDGSNVLGVALYIRNHRDLKGRLAFNLLTKEVEVDGAPMQKHHVAAFRKIMHNELLKARKSDVEDEMDQEARRNQYDPLLDYLAGCRWDGKDRIETWLVDYMGARPSDYIHAVGPRILIGSVARAFRPGCKLDTMPVFEGDQGIGKSTAIRYLYGEQFFIDDLADFTSKDTFQLIQGAWACEIAELAALNKSEVSDVKKFLTKVSDKFRAPYERAPIQVPRRTVFIGSVNPESGVGYLRDSTGARRFWPIECGNVDLRGILRDRDQLWAEAVVRFNDGWKWHLETVELSGLAQVEQHKRREVHPWEESVLAYVRSGFNGGPVRVVTIEELLAEAIKLPVERRDTRASRQIGAILRQLGWESETERRAGSVVRVFRNPQAMPSFVD